MKRFRLIGLPSTVPDLTPEQAEADRVDYIACIRQVIRAPLDPRSGVQLEEMEKGLRVLKALDGKKLGDILALEDADHAHLCDKVRAARWAVVDERLVRFSRTVLDATEDVLDEPNSKPADGSDANGTEPPSAGVDSDTGPLRPRLLASAREKNGHPETGRSGGSELHGNRKGR